MSQIYLIFKNVMFFLLFYLAVFLIHGPSSYLVSLNSVDEMLDQRVFIHCPVPFVKVFYVSELDLIYLSA